MAGRSRLKAFPKHKVQLFRVEVSANRTDWVVTNDLAQNSTSGTQDACAIRWKIEQLHREIKQLTAVEKCQNSKKLYFVRGVGLDQWIKLAR